MVGFLGSWIKYILPNWNTTINNPHICKRWDGRAMKTSDAYLKIEYIKKDVLFAQPKQSHLV